MTVVAVVGLGYVGLPVAVEFGKKGRTIGFDLSRDKVESYRRYVDPSGEVSGEDLRAARTLEVTTDPAAIAPAADASRARRPRARDGLVRAQSRAAGARTRALVAR